MTYYYIFNNDSDSLAAQSFLRSQYGSTVHFQGVSIPSSLPNQVGLGVTFNDSSITLNDSDTAIQNATGQYIVGTDTLPQGSSPSSPGGFGSLDLGAFLNSIGNAIKNAIPSLKFPGFAWLWWVIIGLVVLVFAVLFTSSFSKGLGKGIAARV